MAKACLYKVFLSMNYNKVSAPSLLLQLSPLSPLLPNETVIDLLHEGALRALPSNLPTLFNSIEWAI
jgi:hypothetical protein